MAMETTVSSSAAFPIRHGTERGVPVATAVDDQKTTASPPRSPRTISELIDIKAKETPNQPILGYPSEGIEYVEYTYDQLNRFANVGASKLAENLPLRQSSNEGTRVVAILGPSTLDYFVTVLALSRLGFTVLFLSTRIADLAHASLLHATGCSHILIDRFFQNIVANVQKRVPDLRVYSILQRDQYDVDRNVPPKAVQTLDLSVETGKNCWIIHSSGSTGLPKPIYQTHKAALRNYENNMGMEGFITLPLFHNHGLSSVFRGLIANKKIFMYNASLPLTSHYLLGIMRRHRFQIFYGVPYALKLLSETSEGIEALAAMKVVMFGGSACPDVLGNLLVERSVNLVSHYGCTETGQLMTSFRPSGDKAWNYVRVPDQLVPFVRFEDRGGNMFEIVVLDGWPSKVATNREDGSYATKDLFVPHPTIGGAWKFVGRQDDTIVLVNGEKTIPLAMEGVVRQQKWVQDAVMFGSGKSQLGLMVIASQFAAGMSGIEVLDAIWPAIEGENKNYPAYAQLGPESVVVLPAGTPYPQTDKGTLIRPAFYKAFSNQIEQFYAKLERLASAGTLKFDFTGTCNFLREAVLEIAPTLVPADVTKTADLFSLGVDSLQSIRLRSSILRNLQLNGRSLSNNFVFENPSLARMAETIINIREGRQSEGPRDVEEQMAELVSKYARDFPRHIPQSRTSSRRCVVVTGATGSLGAHIVARLAASAEDVDEVCCLVRAGSDRSARQRVLQSLKQRAVLHSLSLDARRKISAYRIDFSDPRLGLSEETYERLTYDIVHIIHCAWSVNFNKQLSSFEGDCIAGTKNLILLCLAARQPSPASLNFSSSVSTVVNTPGDNPVAVEALPESFSCAQGMGYAQSKLVAEHLCARARVETGMNARVLRVGQIVADTVYGIWNDTEAIPLMLQAATTMGVLPALDETSRWLPVDNVASAMVDISLSPVSSQVFFNVVNPAMFHWTRDLLPALHASGLLSFEQVDQHEWIRRLQTSNPDPVSNPTFKLVEFFAAKYDNDNNGGQQQHKRSSPLAYETTATERLSRVIASRPKTGEDVNFVTKFISRFLATSWARPSTVPMGSCRRSVRLVVVEGSGRSGKSTIISLLVDRLQQQARSRNVKAPILVVEADAAHDAIAVTKMGTGIGLSALDREIWLSRIRIHILELIRAAENSSTMTIFVGCSTLERTHRDIFRRILPAGKGTPAEPYIRTDFVLLEMQEKALDRMAEVRKGHCIETEEEDVLPVDTEADIEELVEDVVCQALR